MVGQVHKVWMLVASLFVLEKEIIDANENYWLVALIEVNLRCFNLIDTWYIHLGTELANNDVWVVDLPTDNLAVAVDTRHDVVARMHVCT